MIRILILTLSCCLALDVAAAPSFFAQKSTTGAVKGKVREENGKSVGGVTVIAQQDERDIASVLTNGKGEFTLINLPAGSYKLVFRKLGLRVGTIQGVVVEAGKTRGLRDRLVLPEDEGSITLVRGSVFDENGRSVRGAAIEIARVSGDGTTRRFDGRLSDSMGEFAFRVAPTRALYRVTAKRSGAEPVSKDVEVDGVSTYRVALTLRPRTASAN